MSRKREIYKKRSYRDPKFDSLLVGRFVNALMGDGKKSVARGILYHALDELAEKTKRDPLDVFTKAVENVKPILEVKSRRVGGATYQVPIEVRPNRREALSVRWIINSARNAGSGPMALRLATELIDAYNKRGNSIKKREDVHKMAEANKAFAHYRW